MQTQGPEGPHKSGGSNTPTANFIFNYMEGDITIMDANKIEKFIDAGYTKEEIELLFKDPKVDPEQEKGPEKKETEQKTEISDNSKMDQKNSQTNSDNDTMASAIKTLTDTVNALSDTVKAMQAANIDSSKTESNKDNTVESVMKSFIEKL